MSAVFCKRISSSRARECRRELRRTQEGLPRLDVGTKTFRGGNIQTRAARPYGISVLRVLQNTVITLQCAFRIPKQLSLHIFISLFPMALCASTDSVVCVLLWLDSHDSRLTTPISRGRGWPPVSSLSCSVATLFIKSVPGTVKSEKYFLTRKTT